MKKPFYKCWWFWGIIIAVAVLCAGNILLAHFYKESGANIFTAVSGWVSGIATAILGVIAVIQNRTYKDENDIYLREQERIITRFADSQKDLAWRNLQYQFFNSYLNTLLQQKNRLQEFSLKRITNDVISLSISKESFAKIAHERNMLLENIDGLIEFLKTSKYYFSCKETLYKSALQYKEEVEDFIAYIIAENKYANIHDLFSMNANNYTLEQKALYKEFNHLVDKTAKTRITFNNELAAHINEVYVFIADIYYSSTDELKIAIIKNKSEYDEWKDKIETEEQNNG